MLGRMREIVLIVQGVQMLGAYKGASTETTAEHCARLRLTAGDLTFLHHGEHVVSRKRVVATLLLRQLFRSAFPNTELVRGIADRGQDCGGRELKPLCESTHEARTSGRADPLAH